MKSTVLLIDDEEPIRKLLSRIIGLEGFAVFQANSLAVGLKLLKQEAIDILLCDVKLPDGNGVDFVIEVKAKFPSVEIILLTAYGNIPDGVAAIKNGAFDYIVKGDDNNKIIPLLTRATEKSTLAKRIRQLESQVGKKYSFDTMGGQAAIFLDAIALAKKVAATDTTVLLLGETGTGKEVFAQAIHQASSRCSKSFVAINCSAFSKELLENELFGHRAGAFTGAVSDQKGLFEEAHLGTLFMDEVGEMPIDLQAKLLRVLETGEFFRVGDTKPVKVDVRIITATNRDLAKEIEAMHFRQDLYYRLSVFPISLPALKERVSDIKALAQSFTATFAVKTNKPIPKLSNEYVNALMRYNWPGNIRELKNVIERSVILEDSGELDLNTLPIELQVTRDIKGQSAFTLSAFEKLHIAKVLRHTNGNKTESARLLGIGLTTLYRKIEEYQL